MKMSTQFKVWAVAVRSHRRRSLAAVLAVLVAAVLGVHLMSLPSAGAGSTAFPQDAAMEDQLGVRFNRVAVVGDGGLVELSYVVLDSAKAGRFQSDSEHPPLLVSEAREASTQRVSVMKQGHTLRQGQTYYLMYQNTRAALRSGESATIVQGDVSLPHVPVL